MKPIYTLLKAADYVTTQWSGGATTQLAIAPAGAVYADRDFLWRVSSATVETDESDFTPLPDYRRFISTVRGDMTLSHNGGAELTLRPGDVHAFDGGDDTHSVGRCTDFNLMLRKGKADGVMHSVFPDGGAEYAPDPRARTLLFFCASGAAELTCRDGAFTLAAGESLLVENADGAPFRFSRFEGMVMAAEMWSLDR